MMDSELVEGTSSLTIAAPQIYTPLQPSRNQIRLAPIQCTLLLVEDAHTDVQVVGNRPKRQVFSSGWSCRWRNSVAST
jgi:hypothetical protein